MSDSPQRTHEILEPDDTDHNVGGLKSMVPKRKQVRHPGIITYLDSTQILSI